jgi:hypothetical protein
MASPLSCSRQARGITADCVYAILKCSSCQILWFYCRWFIPYMPCLLLIVYICFYDAWFAVVQRRS